MAANSFNHIPALYNEKSAEEILPFIINEFDPKSILDVGCGIGGWLSVARKLGVNDITGIDGWYVDTSKLYIPEDLFIKKDLTKAFDLKKEYDLLMCLEVAEHIDEQYADIFIASLVKHSKLILFSAAIPNQVGENHVNEQYPEYWQKKFQHHGFQYYDIMRSRFWENKNIHWWYKQNMFIVAHKDINLKFDICEKIHSYVHPQLYSERMALLKGLLGENLKANFTGAARLLKQTIIRKLKR
jgi:SAM-dependent methyltransferase